MHVQKEMLSTHLTHLLTVVQAQQKINHVDYVFPNKPKHMINVLFFVLICFTGILNAAGIHYITVSVQFCLRTKGA